MPRCASRWFIGTLAERAGHDGAVEQIAGSYPQSPAWFDVEGEACRALVELPYQGVDLGQLEVGPDQFVRGGDDTDSRGVGCVVAAERACQVPGWL